MAANPTVDFLLLGDRPVKHTLPHNVRFHSLRPAALVSRLRNASGVRPAQFALTGWGHTAKVNDLKPLFGLLFADILLHRMYRHLSLNPNYSKQVTQVKTEEMRWRQIRVKR